MPKNEIKIVRMFEAPRDIVFQAWTEPRYILQWWGPEGFTCPYATVDLKVGGKFHFAMHGMGMEHWVVGEYSPTNGPEIFQRCLIPDPISP